MTSLLLLALLIGTGQQRADTGRQGTSDEAEALRVAVTQAIAADSSPDHSIQHVNERIERWSFVLLRANRGSPEAIDAEAAVARARQDLQEARSRAFEAGNLDESTRGVFDAKLAAARDYVAVKEWVEAEQNLRYVLDRSPSYPPALSLLDELQRKQRAAESQRMMIIVGIVLAVVLALGVLVVVLGLQSREERQVEVGGVGVASSQNVVLQVVEGVKRGTVMTIGRDRPAFRIGSTDRAQDRNDLIISDSARLVSRSHCAVIRSAKGGYCLVDSSTNGTFLNGAPLKKGEEVPLTDGDEITIADVSRLKFTHP